MNYIGDFDKESFQLVHSELADKVKDLSLIIDYSTQRLCVALPFNTQTTQFSTLS